MSRPTDSPGTLSPQVRSFLSLFLVIHLFVLLICAFSVLEASRLQQRLLGVLAPYAQLLNFDLDYSPYYLTRDPLNDETLDQFLEREYRTEVLPEGADPQDPEAWQMLGEDWGGSSPAYRRLQRLAYIPVASTREESQSAMALGLARLGAQQLGQPVSRVRIRQHKPVPQLYVEEGVSFDENDPVWFRVAYEARIVGDAVLPVVARGEAAPVVPPDTP